jgi:nicotinamidase/pyrazinamidase
MKKALLVVDIQNDFVSGGSLAVKDGEKIIPLVNQLMDQFDLVVASQDWHPANHKSFASNHEGKSLFEVIDLNGSDQVLWPDHCVQSSRGAQFCEELNTNKFHKIFQKGLNPEVDSYSAFFDNQYKSATGLSEYLKEQEVEDLYIVGLATDFCVKFSCIDAVKEGFKTNLFVNAAKPVNPDFLDECLQELKDSGVNLIIE